MAGLARGMAWSSLLGEVTEQGAAFAARAVMAACCRELAAELGGGPYEPVASVIGQVRQQAESFEVPVEQLYPRYPVLADLCDELVGRIHRHGVPEWMPNEVAIQRYQPGSLGITPHRDQRRFAQLVAVVTIAGSAPFTLCRNRAGDPVRIWQADGGSLVLLRGPGLAGHPDGRPMHSVGGPTGGTPRTSIGIRMHTVKGVTPRRRVAVVGSEIRASCAPVTSGRPGISCPDPVVAQPGPLFTNGVVRLTGEAAAASGG